MLADEHYSSTKKSEAKKQVPSQPAASGEKQPEIHHEDCLVLQTSVLQGLRIPLQIPRGLKNSLLHLALSELIVSLLKNKNPSVEFAALVKLAALAELAELVELPALVGLAALVEFAA